MFHVKHLLLFCNRDVYFAQMNCQKTIKKWFDGIGKVNNLKGKNYFDDYRDDDVYITWIKILIL